MTPPPFICASPSSHHWYFVFDICSSHSSRPVLPLLSPVRHVPGAASAFAGTQKSLVRRDRFARDLAQLGRLAIARAQTVVDGDRLVSVLALQLLVIVDKPRRRVPSLVVEGGVFRGHYLCGYVGIGVL